MSTTFLNAASSFFLPDVRSRGSRFCIYYPAKNVHSAREPQGMVLYVQPFAEEMNKSRHVVARQAREFSNAGFSVLQIDLLGCGDSSGEFADATWAAWIQDIVGGYDWLEKNIGHHFKNINSAPLWLWGLRAGCLLAADAAHYLHRPCSFIFWQPVVSGAVCISDFMRLKLTATMFSGSGLGEKKDLKEQLAKGGAVDILGYTLSRELAQGLALSKLHPPNNMNSTQYLAWFETAPTGQAIFSPAGFKTIGLWKDAGFEIISHCLQVPSFWCSNELQNAPELIALTTQTIAASGTGSFKALP